MTKKWTDILGISTYNPQLANELATEALAELADIADDAKITPVEKLDVKQRWDIIVVEATADTGTIPVQATAIGVSDADFDTAFDALDTYLNTTIEVFVNMDITTDIVRADWDIAWKNYYNERTLLLNAITTKTQENLATNLGYTNYAEMVSEALAGKTIISGGLIRTSLLDADAVVIVDEEYNGVVINPTDGVVITAIIDAVPVVVTLNATVGLQIKRDGVVVGGIDTDGYLTTSRISNPATPTDYYTYGSVGGATGLSAYDEYGQWFSILGSYQDFISIWGSGYEHIILGYNGKNSQFEIIDSGNKSRFVLYKDEFPEVLWLATGKENPIIRSRPKIVDASDENEDLYSLDAYTEITIPDEQLNTKTGVATYTEKSNAPAIGVDETGPYYRHYEESEIYLPISGVLPLGGGTMTGKLIADDLGIDMSAVADSASAATHYYVETASGNVVPKTLANVKTELVTKAAIEAVLTGNITSHTHSNTSDYFTKVSEEFDGYSGNYYGRGIPNNFVALGSGTTGNWAIRYTGHPGIAYIKSTTTNPSGGTLYSRNSVGYFFPYEKSTYIFNVQSVAATKEMCLGRHNAQAADAAYPTAGHFFYLDNTTLKGCAGNVYTTTTTSYTISANIWYKGVIEVNAGMSVVTFSLYNDAGELLWTDTVTVAVSTSASVPYFNGKCVSGSGAASDLLIMDYYSYEIPNELVR